MSSMWDKRKEIKASNPYSVKPKPMVQRVVELEKKSKNEGHISIVKRVETLETGFKHLRQQNTKIVDLLEIIIEGSK